MFFFYFFVYQLRKKLKVMCYTLPSSVCCARQSWVHHWWCWHYMQPKNMFGWSWTC